MGAPGRAILCVLFAIVLLSEVHFRLVSSSSMSTFNRDSVVPVVALVTLVAGVEAKRRHCFELKKIGLFASASIFLRYTSIFFSFPRPGAFVTILI